jgi:glutathione peroxidase
MTPRQKILKIIYPALMGITKLFGAKSKKMENKNHVQAGEPFYGLTTLLNNKQPLSFASLKGKKVLLVNTASDCGYTNQYKDLQELYVKYQNKLVVLGFPANDFKEQEKGEDEAIAQFCQVNFGVSFPLAAKSSVISGAQQNPVFNWLSTEQLNGWCAQQPTWNFSKYLVNEEGVLTHYFDPSVSPLSNEMINAIENK